MHSICVYDVNMNSNIDIFFATRYHGSDDKSLCAFALCCRLFEERGERGKVEGKGETGSGRRETGDGRRESDDIL